MLGEDLEDKVETGPGAAAAAEKEGPDMAPQSNAPEQMSNGTAAPAGADSSADRLSASSTAKSA